MKGVRLPDVTGEPWQPEPWPPANGSYWRSPRRVGATELVWMVTTPNGLLGNLAGHTIIEHDDGTISASQSILVTGHDRSYHGYLERGIWRSC